MNILYVVPYVPNPIRVRSYELVQALARHGHQITLATLWNTQEDRRDLEILSSFGVTVVAEHLTTFRSVWNCLCALPSSAPLQAAYCWQPALLKSLQSLLYRKQFDIIHVEHLRGARYGLALKEIVTTKAPSTPVVWDSVDCISHLFKQAAEWSQSIRGRWVTRFELNRTRWFEGWLVNQFNRVLITSASDQQALYDLAVQANIDLQGKNAPTTHLAVLPNGVNLTRFPSDNAARQAHTIVFSGKMSYHANITAAHYLVNEIMPRVWEDYPNAQVQIVGKDPPASVCALASQGRNPARQDAVMVTGAVPEIYTYLQQATIAVAPIVYGAGVQNKVLEAMACGAPVVASVQAASGLGALANQELLVANTPQEFSNAIIALFNDPERRRQIQKAGRAYVERFHSWDVITTKLETIYQETRNSILNKARVKL